MRRGDPVLHSVAFQGILDEASLCIIILHPISRVPHVLAQCRIARSSGISKVTWPCRSLVPCTSSRPFSLWIAARAHPMHILFYLLMLSATPVVPIKPCPEDTISTLCIYIIFLSWRPWPVMLSQLQAMSCTSHESREGRVRRRLSLFCKHWSWNNSIHKSHANSF